MCWGSVRPQWVFARRCWWRRQPHCVTCWLQPVDRRWLSAVDELLPVPSSTRSSRYSATPSAVRARRTDHQSPAVTCSPAHEITPFLNTSALCQYSPGDNYGKTGASLELRLWIDNIAIVPSKFNWHMNLSEIVGLRHHRIYRLPFYTELENF